MERLKDWNRWQWGLCLAGALLVSWGLNLAADVLSRPSPEQIAQGRELFVHEWTVNDPLSPAGDGLGPVFNANSCVACHFQGGVGGAGPNQHNVTTFLALPLPNAKSPTIESGVIHADAIADVFRERLEDVQSRHPILKGLTRTVGGCSYSVPDFNPVLVDSINTPAIFGAGLIDALPGSEISSQHRWNALEKIGQELQGNFGHKPLGRVRILDDGRVGKFGWKAQFATLEEFVAAACAVEVGLTNPLRQQDIPREHKPDPDAGLDLDRAQFKSLVAFCKTLPAPEQRNSSEPALSASERRGELLFASVGCADCHTPDIGNLKGVYSDFLLHALTSAEDGDYEPIPSEIPRRSRDPEPHEWKTPPLWGVADTAPYMHDGSAPTLEAAIRQHGGSAKKIRKRYEELSKDARGDLIAFLKTLKAPSPEALVVQTNAP